MKRKELFSEPSKFLARISAILSGCIGLYIVFAMAFAIWHMTDSKQAFSFSFLIVTILMVFTGVYCVYLAIYSWLRSSAKTTLRIWLITIFLLGFLLLGTMFEKLRLLMPEMPYVIPVNLVILLAAIIIGCLCWMCRKNLGRWFQLSKPLEQKHRETLVKQFIGYLVAILWVSSSVAIMELMGHTHSLRAKIASIILLLIAWQAYKITTHLVIRGHHTDQKVITD
ncbi:MAG: hypothetical protein PHQ35_03055 [Phycisphaerae bacterium]|nr:hypothetical protein [Phycisphaerae bacterium]MDD5380728.1 hypothetical protein [Phycisphaerae bacterium]